MASDKRTGTAIPAGILRPTTPPETPQDGAGQGGEVPAGETTAPEPRTPLRRARKAAAAPKADVEGRRLYLSEGVHFRLRMAAYQRGKKLSEMAEEVLDKNLPVYDVNRKS